MNKSELIDAIAESAGISKKEAGNALDGMMGTVTRALENGDKVSLIGFGTFSVVKRAARKAKNPQNGKMIDIPAKNVAKFKPGAKLAEAVK